MANINVSDYVLLAEASYAEIPLPKPSQITRTTPFLTQTCRPPFQKQPALQTFKVQAAFFIQSSYTSAARAGCRPIPTAAAPPEHPNARLLQTRNSCSNRCGRIAGANGDRAVAAAADWKGSPPPAPPWHARARQCPHA